jgi:serpin B
MPVAAPAQPTLDLGLRLLGQLGTGQVALSPLGLHRALATVREGASGAAREALDALVGPEPTPAIEVADPAVELLLAQGVWVHPEHPLAPVFAARAAELGVGVGPLDVAAVNAWAAERTRGMVPRVVDELEDEEKLALTDAACFEGTWTEPFDPSGTKPRPFMRPDGSAVRVPTMVADGSFPYAEHEELRAVRLPYGADGELGLLAVAARDGLEPPRLDGARWAALRDALGHREGRVALPRLRLESSLSLRDPLIALGLGPAFEPGGDFENLFQGQGPKALGRVLQRARVDVDEHGTRAVAVTTVTAVLTSLGPEPFDLRLDRPFLWAIEHRPTGTPLFLGIVTDPEETV